MKLSFTGVTETIAIKAPIRAAGDPDPDVWGSCWAWPELSGIFRAATGMPGFAFPFSEKGGESGWVVLHKLVCPLTFLLAWSS
jgi:hypothetical protein